MKDDEKPQVMEISLALGDDALSIEEHGDKWRIVADFTDWNTAQTVFNAVLKYLKNKEKGNQ